MSRKIGAVISFLILWKTITSLFSIFRLNIFCSILGVDFINWSAPYINLLRLAPNFCASKKLLKKLGIELK